MDNPHKIIYLQWHEPIDNSQTWASDQIHDSDVKYIRFDLIDSIIGQIFKDYEIPPDIGAFNSTCRYCAAELIDDWDESHDADCIYRLAQEIEELNIE